ncbi:MAG: hypothetical protein ACRDRW_17425 [Pseudonocardiaceae bacterium]
MAVGQSAVIVPATARPAEALRDPRHIQISQMTAERFGAPTLAHYRRAYDSSGTPRRVTLGAMPV